MNTIVANTSITLNIKNIIPSLKIAYTTITATSEIKISAHNKILCQAWNLTSGSFRFKAMNINPNHGEPI